MPIVVHRSDVLWRPVAGRTAAPTLDATATNSDGTYTFSLRWVIAHMIEETGRHLGHMDLLRELADGAVGEDPGST
jgi:hypothetical protein